MNAAAGDAARQTMVFSLEGLAERDEVLFKSFVRLLDHRTRHRWVQRTEQPQADLRIVAQGHALPASDAAGAPVLVLGAQHRGGHFLSLPIHADALETQLNLLGELIGLARGRRGPVSAPAPLAALPPATAPAGPQAVRLLRWPAAELLRSPDRIRLATLMTGRPLGIEELQLRTGISAARCAAFVQELRAAGLLSTHAVESEPPRRAAPRVADVQQPGLFERIRRRLGLVQPVRT
ncbi:MAG TPA: hypothetical protein VLJ58_12040 [Ramlibacter sp.]|nr:hypothetical protein [Ramlibacter sp.]